MMTAFGGMVVKPLLARYGSPLFIVSEMVVRQKINEIRASLDQYYPDSEMFYSLKTNTLPAIGMLVKRYGARIEVASGFEYWLAKKIGFFGPEIIFNGPDKKDDELEAAISDGAMVHIDNEDELERVGAITRKQPVKIAIGMRVATALRTSGKDNRDLEHFPNTWGWRFGFNMANGDALHIAQRIRSRFPHLDIASIHLHLGTRLREPRYFCRAAFEAQTFARELRSSLGFSAAQIDLGGGFYETPIADYIRGIAEEFGSAKDQFRLAIEPGTYIINDAVILATSVLHASDDGKIQRVTVDASTSLLFPAHFAPLPIVHGTSDGADDLPLLPSLVFGNSCVNSDVLATDVELPRLTRGDPVIIPSCGAYTISRSQQFIYPRPAVVLIDATGSPRVIREREQNEDLLACDIFP